MVMSMTGYGRAEKSSDNISVVVELRSVNHRYFEFSVKAPRTYGFLEDRLKGLCQSRITRGKIDMFVTLDTSAAGDSCVTVNNELAEQYIKAVRGVAEQYGIPEQLDAVSVLRFPDVFSVQREALDEDLIWSIVSETAGSAIEDFIKMREKEGKKLAEDIESRIKIIEKKVELIEQRSPETVRLYREKLEARIKELLGDSTVDEQRLLTETAIFADKIAVAEETVRLRSHMQQLRDMMESPDAVGRKLDFIVQEMNREANTIGSKAQDVEIAHTVVDIKAEIEKIREQVQNIE